MRLLIIGFVLMISMTSCETENACQKCKSAIIHMADKIQNQGCNPNTMQNAWDGINKECPNNKGDKYVGYMAETCYLQNLMVPNCGENAQVPATTQITFSFLLGAADDTLKIFLTNRNSNFIRANLVPFQTTKKNLDITVREGEPVKIAVAKISSTKILLQETVNFTFDRKSNWNSTRTIQVDFDLTTGYNLTLLNW